MRIAAISDLHGFLPETPACDLLLVGGDLCPLDDHTTAYQHRWLKEAFAPWLEARPAGAVVGIAGNHDFVAEGHDDLMRELPWTYLRDEAVSVGGLRLWGTPWTPLFQDWAFMEPDDRLGARFGAINGGTDVLIAHGPPLGFGVTVAGDDAGSASLLEAIDRVAPRLCIYGHIHERFGVDRRGDTVLGNVSHVNELYEPVHAATLFDLN